MTPVPALVAAAGYVAGSVLIWRARWRTASLWLAALALVLHATALFGQIFSGGNLTLGVTEALSVFSWQAAVFLCVLCLFQPVEILGVAIFPLAAAAVVAAALWPTSVAGIPLADWKIQLHVVLSLFSAGFLTLAATQAVTLAIQDRMLHQATPNRIVMALPPLQSMEHLLFVLISLGFFILSLALLSGLLFVDDLMAQHLAHKTVLSIVAWAIFGALLWGRWRRGWRGRTAIRWSLWGYGVLIVAYFGTKVILEQILSRHWT